MARMLQLNASTRSAIMSVIEMLRQRSRGQCPLGKDKVKNLGKKLSSNKERRKAGICDPLHRARLDQIVIALATFRTLSTLPLPPRHLQSPD